jgi:hypothetical protein
LFGGFFLSGDSGILISLLSLESFIGLLEFISFNLSLLEFLLNSIHSSFCYLLGINFFLSSGRHGIIGSLCGIEIGLLGIEGGLEFGFLGL